jgi:hypothetical protein
MQVAPVRLLHQSGQLSLTTPPLHPGVSICTVILVKQVNCYMRVGSSLSHHAPLSPRPPLHPLLPDLEANRAAHRDGGATGVGGGWMGGLLGGRGFAGVIRGVGEEVCALIEQ